MPSTLVLLEHEYHPFDWNDRHLRLLERARQAYDGDVLTATTRSGRRVLKAHHYVGTVRLGGDVITILPKIDYGNDRHASAARNLLYMLEQAGYLPAHHQSLAPTLRASGDWFELLTRIFAVELLGQWTRGPHRRYQSVADELPVIRGRWQIAQQLRRPARDHRFDVAYDEFTADNPLSRVFRYVVEQLWLRARDSDNRRLLGELRGLMEEVSLLPHMTAAYIPPAAINRLNARFEPVLNLARVFLARESLELTPGDVRSHAIVFDMNRLFEAFLAGFIQRRRATVLPPALRNCALHPHARGHGRYLGRSETGRAVFQLQPDMAFRRGDDFPLLVDAKYKPPEEGGRLLVGQADFYQMFAYAHRYRAPRVLLLFPQTTTPWRARFNLIDHPATICVATVNLRRRLNSPASQQALAEELRQALAMGIDNGTDN